MIVFNEIACNGEIWEQFARLFFTSLGYAIDSCPDRGSDDGKDLIISENLQGSFCQHKFKWLVSYKNFFSRNKSVGTDDEQNICDRCEQHNVDGFIGFYSTTISSLLNRRLNEYKNKKKLKEFMIFDGKTIEDYLLRYNMSSLLIQFFPESYKRVRPVHKLFDLKYDLKCDVCGKDLFQTVDNGYNSAIVWVKQPKGGVLENINLTEKIDYEIVDCYCACKGKCDSKAEAYFRKKYTRCATLWEDLSDLVRPNIFLRYMLSLINVLNDGSEHYTIEALKKEMNILIAVAQKVFREVTEEDEKRLKEEIECGG